MAVPILKTGAAFCLDLIGKPEAFRKECGKAAG